MERRPLLSIRILASEVFVLCSKPVVNRDSHVDALVVAGADGTCERLAVAGRRYYLTRGRCVPLT